MADTVWSNDPGAVGNTMPIVPQVPSQFISDYKDAQLGQAFTKGIFPGIIKAIFGNNPADIAAAYNGTLTGAQGTEQGRLKTAYYDQANGVGQQQAPPQYAPQQAPGGPAPGQGLISAMANPDGQMSPEGGSFVAPPQQRPGLISTMAGGGAPGGPPPGARLTAPPVSGGFGLGQLQQGLATSYKIPGFEASIGPLVSAITKQQELGTQYAPDGSIVQIPGFLGTATNTALAKAHIAPVADPMDPRSVTGAVAGQAGAVKGAEAGAQNASDLAYKPLIAGGEANAKLPATYAEAGNKAWLDSLGKWVAPTETRPGNDVVQFSGTGAPQRSQFMAPGAAGSTTGPIPVAGRPSTLYANNGETFNTGKSLADETAQSRTAADGAYTQRALYQKMLDQVGGATLGANSADRSAFKNFINTYTGFDTSKPVTQDQVFDKLATQVAGQATKQLDQTAVAALETMRKAYPNRDMTPQALREMVGQLSGLQDYIIAKDQARQQHIATNGTASGFTQGAWVKQNTPDKFINQGIVSTIPEGARSLLQQKPETAAQFDAKYGPGMSKIVLGTR